MVALNFVKQFAADVESGAKDTTFRRRGKRQPPKVGDQLQLYTGMRTKQCRLLRTAPCHMVLEARIIPKFWEVHVRLSNSNEWIIYDSEQSLLAFARKDGFSTYKEFFDYFEKDVDENGVVEGYFIKWGNV